MGCKLVTTTMLGIYVNLFITKKKKPFKQAIMRYNLEQKQYAPVKLNG